MIEAHRKRKREIENEMDDVSSDQTKYVREIDSDRYNDTEDHFSGLIREDRDGINE